MSRYDPPTRNSGKAVHHPTAPSHRARAKARVTHEIKRILSLVQLIMPTSAAIAVVLVCSIIYYRGHFKTPMSAMTSLLWSTPLVWIIAEIVATLVSAYYAQKWTRMHLRKRRGRLQSDSARRRPQLMPVAGSEEFVPTSRCRAPPQVMRWDILGVAASNLFGKICTIPMPVCCRHAVYTCMGRLGGINFAEIRDPLESFKNLQEFFTRPLAPGLRPLADASITSPADGRVVVCGKVQGDNLECVKGVRYSLSQFLGENITRTTTTESRAADADELIPEQGANIDAGSDGECSDAEDEDVEGQEAAVELIPLRPGNSLFQCVIYLAPGDYHRFHAAANHSVERVRHFPGTLFPISPVVARLIPNLFSLNERVIASGEWRHGFFSMTAVGAYNVGSICFKFDSDLKTNRISRNLRNPNLQLFSYGGVGRFAYDTTYGIDEVTWSKGDEVGMFKLGSTIVLLFEAPSDFQFTVQPGMKVRVGQAL